MALDAAVGSVAARLERTTAGWIDKLNAIASKNLSGDAATSLADEGLDAVGDSGGVTKRAGAEAVKAHLHGKNPAWAAIRGAWQEGTPAVRAAIVTAGVGAVVLLLLSPALLLVYLLSWVVVAAVARSRSSHRRQAVTT
jgi:hypothetical protein